MNKIKIVFFLAVLVFGVTPVFADQSDKGQCPQKRTTKNAPANFLKLTNPLELTQKRLKKGEILYLKISDGQMFWAIKNGIKGTSMPSYSDLADWEIWVLIHYIRQFGK